MPKYTVGTKSNQIHDKRQDNRIASEVAKDLRMLSAYFRTKLTQIP
jgi:hypothetical protein